MSVPAEASKVQRVLSCACAHAAETGEAPMDMKLPQIRAPRISYTMENSGPGACWQSQEMCPGKEVNCVCSQ